MREYGQIQSALWTNPRFKRLSVDGRLLYTYLLSGPHSNGLGCFPLSKYYVCGDFGWDLERVSKGFAELFQNGFANHCEKTDFVQLNGYLKWNPIANANVAKARAREFNDIPGDFEFRISVAQEMRDFGNHWPKGFETVLATITETVNQTVTETVTQTRPDPTRPDIQKKNTPNGASKENPEHPEKTNPKRNPKVTEHHQKIAKAMAVHVNTRHPEQKINIDEWADSIRKIFELDGKTESQLAALWAWIQQHGDANFSWADQIRSPMKLRSPDRQGLKYFDRLTAEMQREAMNHANHRPRQPDGHHELDQIQNRSLVEVVRQGCEDRIEQRTGIRPDLSR